LRYCPLIHKGKDNKENQVYNRAPLILLDRKDKKIKAIVSTSDITQM
jgi:hypothetical protein